MLRRIPGWTTEFAENPLASIDKLKRFLAEDPTALDALPAKRKLERVLREIKVSRCRLCRKLLVGSHEWCSRACGVAFNRATTKAHPSWTHVFIKIPGTNSGKLWNFAENRGEVEIYDLDEPQGVLMAASFSPSVVQKPRMAEQVEA